MKFLFSFFRLCGQLNPLNKQTECPGGYLFLGLMSVRNVVFINRNQFAKRRNPIENKTKLRPFKVGRFQGYTNRKCRKRRRIKPNCLRVIVWPVTLNSGLLKLFLADSRQLHWIVMLGAERSTLSELAKMTAASQAERTVLVRDWFVFNTCNVKLLHMQGHHDLTEQSYSDVDFNCVAVANVFITLRRRAWCSFAEQLVGQSPIHPSVND